MKLTNIALSIQAKRKRFSITFFTTIVILSVYAFRYCFTSHRQVQETAMLVIQIFCGFLVATASSILAMPLEEPILAMGEVKGAMKSTQAIDKGKAKLVEFGEHDIDDLYPKREPLPKVEKKSLDPTESEYKPPAKTFADIPDSQLTLEQRRIKYGQSWALGGKATSWVWEHIIQPPFNLLKKTWNFLTTPIVKGDKAHPDEALEVLKKYGISVKKEPVKFNIGDPSTWIESQRPLRICKSMSYPMERDPLRPDPL